MTQTPASPSRTGVLAELVDIARTVAIGLAAALALHATLFQPFTIPSSSMEPGLVTGDYIVVSKFAYGWSLASPSISIPLAAGRLFGRDPKRGDVVVFRLPRDPRQVWIKRVIGLPGDRVQVAGGVVEVNGRALSQTPLAPAPDFDDPDRIVVPTRERQPDGRAYLTYDRGPGSPGDETPVILVPSGTYLVMGDNRDNSLDGRFPAETGVGLLPAENLLGRAEVVVASWRPGASLFKPWTWLNLRPDRCWRSIV
jgi:signal peptidase I